jgi:replication factor C subunit 1
MRSLRNHCLELDFRKPTVQQISKRMLEIAAAEGLAVNQATMDALVAGAAGGGGDIRAVLGQLQMLRLRHRSLSYDAAKAHAGANAKDMEMSPFEAARRLLDADGAALSLSDQIELVFQVGGSAICLLLFLSSFSRSSFLLPPSRTPTSCRS